MPHCIYTCNFFCLESSSLFVLSCLLILLALSVTMFTFFIACIRSKTILFFAYLFIICLSSLECHLHAGKDLVYLIHCYIPSLGIRLDVKSSLNNIHGINKQLYQKLCVNVDDVFFLSNLVELLTLSYHFQDFVEILKNN